MSTWSAIRAVFRRSRAPQLGIAGVHLVPAAANPFGVDLWDCRSFTHGTLSTTKSVEIAQRFAELRRSEGDEVRGHSPFDARLVSCDLEYPVVAPPSDGPLFKATAMEDKWDIYLLEDSLYFVRSWTGELDYVARVAFRETGIHLSRVAVSGHQDSALACRVVDFLVKSHLLGREVPHPLPADLPPTAEQVALFSFHQFGRRCSFGTYADTLPLGAAQPAPPVGWHTPP